MPGLQGGLSHLVEAGYHLRDRVATAPPGRPCGVSEALPCRHGEERFGLGLGYLRSRLTLGATDLPHLRLRAGRERS